MNRGRRTLEVVARDGVPLRTARWRADDARAHALVLQGRGDFLEKHDELAAELTARGCDVVSLDWRGQGGSGRLGAPRSYADALDLGDHVDDIRTVVRAWQDDEPLPGRRLLVAHSMGGPVALRLLRESAQAGDDERVEAAVLLSPMLAFPGAGPRTTRLLAGAACAVGLGARLAHGEQDGGPGAAVAMSTTDADAQRRLAALEAAHPRLVVGGSTWRWVRAAATEMARAASASYDAVTADVLVALAGADRTVDNAAAGRVAERLPRSRVVTYPRQGHDLLLAEPTVRGRVLDDLVRHLGLVHAEAR